MPFAFGRLAVLALTLLLAASACNREPATLVARGLVISVQVASFSRIGTFELRTDDGQVLTFGVEGDPGTTPSHLREHMVLAEPVTVTYHRAGDQLVATRIDD
jgi:hypothetical protein